MTGSPPRRRPASAPTRRCSPPTSGAASGPTAAADRWRSPARSQRPKEGYFGATGGGLWKTTDGGDTWAPVTDGQITSSSVGAVAVSETNPDIVFIGTGESCIRGNIQPGDGVYKSTDAGKTWKHVGFRDAQNISKIRIHPTNPDIVFVAAFGQYGTPNDERGVFKSTDGGATWRKVLFRDNKTGAADLWIDHHNPNVRVRRAVGGVPHWNTRCRAAARAAACSSPRTAASTWTEITRNPGLPAGMIGRIGVSVSGADSNRVYAIVENENGGLFSSDDAGATWKLVEQRAATSGSARSTTRTSRRIRWTRTRSTC